MGSGVNVATAVGDGNTLFVWNLENNAEPITDSLSQLPYMIALAAVVEIPKYNPITKRNRTGNYAKTEFGETA